MRSKDFSWRYSLPATLLLLSPFDLLASLGMDMYLPVVPFMADALGSGAGTIQLTLTAYLVLLGAGQLLFGPLSDRLGRRPVLLGGGIAYIAASFGLTVVSSPELFLSFRVLQACGASACLVSTFATVRDIYSGREESNVIYGLLGSMLAMVPAIGPLLGALVDAWLGWRAIFGLLGMAMIGAVIAAWRLWPETRRHRTADLQWSQLLTPVKHLNFWLYTLCYSAGMGSFFVFFSTAPWLMMGRQGLSQLSFSLLFATVAIAMMATARIMGRLIPRWGSLKTLRVGMGCLMAGALLLAVGENIGTGLGAWLHRPDVARGCWYRHCGIGGTQCRSSRFRSYRWDRYSSLLLFGWTTVRDYRDTHYYAFIDWYHLADHRLLPHPRNSSALSVLHQSQQTPSQPRRT